MSITTKVGDKGSTKLYSGEDVRKTDARIEFCGSIDELVSILGLAYNQEVKEEIKWIQRQLFVIASEVATKEPKYSKLKEKIDDKYVSHITGLCAELESKLVLPTGFILPGANIVSAHLDVARTFTRRCERNYVRLMDNGYINNEFILVWLNRLSDYVYLLARYTEHNNYNLVKES